MMRRSVGAGSFLLAVCLVAGAGCGGPAVESRWRDRLVSVDGHDPEWDAARVYVKDPRVGLGVMNDSTYLYLALRLGDPTLERQVAAGGLTVWLDPRGGRRSTYGIRYPLGALAGLRAPGAETEPEGRPDLHLMQGRFDELLRTARAEVIGPDRQEHHEVPAADGPLRVAATFEGGSLVYEVRVPLSALGGAAALGRPLGLGFETPRPDRDAFRAVRARGGRGPGGSEGERGPGAMGRGLDEGLGDGVESGTDDRRADEEMSRGRPLGSAGEPDALQIWTRVRLAPGAGAPSEP